MPITRRLIPRERPLNDIFTPADQAKLNSIEFGANVGLDSGDALEIVDGITPPSAAMGFAKIYVDSGDGNLKIVFGNGTVKTLATNP